MSGMHADTAWEASSRWTQRAKRLTVDGRRLSAAWETSFSLQVPPERESSSRAMLDAIVADPNNFSTTLLNELLLRADNATQLQQSYNFVAFSEPPPAS
eukprot:2366167-Amphidinium_carterae.1